MRTLRLQVKGGVRTKCGHDGFCRGTKSFWLYNLVQELKK